MNLLVLIHLLVVIHLSSSRVVRIYSTTPDQVDQDSVTEVAEKSEEVKLDMPDDVMDRAAELVSEAEAKPFRFFLTTKYVTLVESVTSTTVVTTHNTCFKTQPGIQTCNRRRRSYNIEVQPPVDSNVFKVEIKPTKIKVDEEVEGERQVDDVVRGIEQGIALTIDDPFPLEVLIDSHEEPFQVSQLEVTDATPTSTESALNGTTSATSGDDSNKSSLIHTTPETTTAMEATSHDDVSESVVQDAVQVTPDPCPVPAESKQALIDLEGSLSNNNWVEREVFGIGSTCFDPSNIVHRFLTVVETRVLLSTITATSYVTAPQMQTVSFASDNACLPKNIESLFSIKCN